MWLFLQNIFLYSTTILVVLICLLLIYYKHLFTYWKKKNVPFLEPTFPFGNMSPNFGKFVGQEIAQIYQTMRGKGHSYCGYYLFGAPVFMPLSLELNKKILVTDFRCFHDRGFYYDEKNDRMGANLASSSGEKWRRWRERLNPLFTAKKTKMVMPIVEKCAQQLDVVLEGYSKNAEAVPIQDLMKRFTVSVICSSAFGVESNCLEDPKSEFFRHANMVFSNNFKDNLRIATGMCAPFVNQIFKINIFNPTASEFFRRVVRDTIAYRKENNVERPDFLNLMIRLKHNMSLEDGAEDQIQYNKREIISDDEIAAQCFVFYVAGFETSASALSFALYELSTNQEVQNKLREEIKSTLKGELSYETLNKMHYLDCVFKETLRKYPTVHMLNRIVSEDFQIPETNIIIKKGTKAVLSPMGVHMDPEYYPNPEIFDPDRFSEENRDKIPPFAYLPFGDGPRICPGFRFGAMQFKICVATIIGKYNLSIHPEMKGEPVLRSIGNVLTTEEPILLKLDSLY